jgi:hypothetical protein
VAFAVFAAHRGLAALEVRRKTAEGKVHADVGFWGGAIPGNPASCAVTTVVVISAVRVSGGHFGGSGQCVMEQIDVVS